MDVFVQLGEKSEVLSFHVRWLQHADTLGEKERIGRERGVEKQKRRAKRERWKRRKKTSSDEHEKIRANRNHRQLDVIVHVIQRR